MMIDGDLAAIGGVSGPIMSTDGLIWLALNERALSHSFSIARAALRQIEDIMRTKRKLSTIILRDDRPAVEFAYFLGFNVEKVDKMWGRDAMLMTLKGGA